MQGVVSTVVLAEELDVAPETVVRWIKEKRIKGAFRRRGRWCIPVEEAEAFADDYERPDWAREELDDVEGLDVIDDE